MAASAVRQATSHRRRRRRREHDRTDPVIAARGGRVGRRRCRDRVAAVLRRLAAVRAWRSRRLPPLHRRSCRRHRRVVRHRRAGAGDDGAGGGPRRRPGAGAILTRRRRRGRTGARAMTLNVLLITLDQFRGDCLSRRRAPARAHAEPRRARRAPACGSPRHYSQAAPCAPGPGQPLHRHVPDEPSGRRQRHAARRPVRQRSPSRPGGPGYAPALFGYTDQALDPRARRRSRRSAAVDVQRHPARLRRRARHPRRPRAVGRLAGRARPRHVARRHGRCWRPSPTARPSTACRRSSPITRSSGCAARTTPWFAHLSYLRPHPPYSAAGEWSDRVRPGRRRRCRSRPPSERHRMHDMVLTDPRTRGARPTRPGCATCGRSTSG